jgi:hypothetical protein
MRLAPLAEEFGWELALEKRSSAISRALHFVEGMRIYATKYPE